MDRINPIARPFVLIAAVGILAASGGCKRVADAHATDASNRAVSPSDNTTAPFTPPTASNPTATAPAMVDYQDKGAHFQYPNNWQPKKDEDYELHLIPAAGDPSRNITFDIPDLPPHFPGMIRLGLIEHGYVDDVKKKHADMHVDSSADHPMPDGAKARLVQSSWKQGNTTHSDIGLLIMRNDKVYILTCDADAKDLAATRGDFDKIAGSLHWDK